MSNVGEMESFPVTELYFVPACSTSPPPATNRAASQWKRPKSAF